MDEHLEKMLKSIETLGNIRSEAFKLSAEMAMHKNMPSRCIEDWDFPKGMQVTAWRKVFDASQKAEDQCREWSIRLRKIADSL